MLYCIVCLFLLIFVVGLLPLLPCCKQDCQWNLSVFLALINTHFFLLSSNERVVFVITKTEQNKIPTNAGAPSDRRVSFLNIMTNLIKISQRITCLICMSISELCCTETYDDWRFVFAWSAHTLVYTFCCRQSRCSPHKTLWCGLYCRQRQCCASRRVQKISFKRQIYFFANNRQ